MIKAQRKAYAGVKTYYFKQKAAEAVLDHAHAQRNGFTTSANVNPAFSCNNAGYYYHGANSCAEALRLMCEKHKEVTGKKVRSDNNVLFEHVVFLSEFQVARLEKKYGQEKVKQAIINRLRHYAEGVKREFGFEPLGIDLHLDEGHRVRAHNKKKEANPTEELENKSAPKNVACDQNENTIFVRNYHAHVQFMNYSFEKRMAPLRHMMQKGKNQDGRTNASNPNFEKLQDLVHQSFANLGFARGEPKSVTGREHLTKEEFVKNKRKKLVTQVQTLTQKGKELENTIQSQNSKAKVLQEQIIQQRSELSWLQMHIEQLKQTHKELTVAIKTKSKHILRSLLRRTDFTTGNFAKRQPK